MDPGDPNAGTHPQDEVRTRSATTHRGHGDINETWGHRRSLAKEHGHHSDQAHRLRGSATSRWTRIEGASCSMAGRPNCERPRLDRVIPEEARHPARIRRAPKELSSDRTGESLGPKPARGPALAGGSSDRRGPTGRAGGPSRDEGRGPESENNHCEGVRARPGRNWLAPPCRCH